MNKWKVMLSAVVIAAALAGCGVQEEQTGLESLMVKKDWVKQSPETDNARTNGPGRGQMGEQADLMGKIKSIDGDTITLYKSAMGQGRPPRDGLDGAATGDDGQQPSNKGSRGAGGDRTAPSGDGTAPQGGGRMNMGAMFTDETVDIQVTDATKIVKVSFENEQTVETEVSLSVLKADDILSVMLKDDTQEAESITIRTGGGFGGGDGRQPAQQEEQAATTSES